MSPFNFSETEIFSFFAVLVRFSVLIAVLPFVGDKVIPNPIKLLLSLSITLALFPNIVAHGLTAANPHWTESAGGIIGVIALESLFGLIMGFVARLAFEAITFGGNLVGNFMGFAAASIYDPHQESHSQVVAQIQLTLAMLIFLAVDGHHTMLRASFESYRIVGIGGAGVLGAAFGQRLVDLSSHVILFGVQLAAPVAVSLFAVNIAFGMMARAMPQLNILVLSFAVSALVGLTILLLSLSEFSSVAQGIFSRMDEWMLTTMQVIAGKR